MNNFWNVTRDDDTCWESFQFMVILWNVHREVKILYDFAENTSAARIQSSIIQDLWFVIEKELEACSVENIIIFVLTIVRWNSQIIRIDFLRARWIVVSELGALAIDWRYLVTSTANFIAHFLILISQSN